MRASCQGGGGAVAAEELNGFRHPAFAGCLSPVTLLDAVQGPGVWDALQALVAERTSLRPLVFSSLRPVYCVLRTLSGSTTSNVEPFPGSLFTSMRPLCASTIILHWNIPMPSPRFLVV